MFDIDFWRLTILFFVIYWMGVFSGIAVVGLVVAMQGAEEWEEDHANA